MSIVAVEGDLDLISAPRLKETLMAPLREGHGRLVLDLSRVPFMDSTALSVLIAVQRRLGPEERMAIAAAGAEVLRVLDLSGLAGTFRVFPTLDDAVEYAEGRSSHAPMLSLTADAALMVGIASTAMPFAESEDDEAERWLRALRRHGEAGAVLASLGVSEASVQPLHAERGRHGKPDPERAPAVTEHAAQIALQRGASKIATTDVLLAVMHVYGASFDRVLAEHGGDMDELAARVSVAHPAAA